MDSVVTDVVDALNRGPGLLRGRHGLVTGCGAIGSAVARVFREHGATVEVWDSAADSSRDSTVRTVDVTCVDDVDQAMLSVDHGHQAVDVLVATAAVAPFGSVLEMPVETWQRVIDVNLLGVVNVCRSVLPGMVQRGRGSIVLMSSVSGLRGEPGAAAYSASKFAVIGLAQSLAHEVGPQGVRVNAICPGAVRSPMNTASMQRYARQRTAEVLDVEHQTIERIALRRLVEPDDVANVALFLASDLSAMVSGETVAVTGGMRS